MFLSYDDIFEKLEIGDFFYDKNLQRFQVLDKLTTNFFIKELIFDDDDGNLKSIYNYTKLTRFLISMGINKNLQKNSFWNKTILLTEESANKLILKKQNDIIIEYNKLLKIGFQTGIINQEELKELTK